MNAESAQQRSTIVVGVDGSAASLAALRWAIAEAKTVGASVDAVTVWHSEALFAPPAGQFTDYDTVREDFTKVLSDAVAAVGTHPGVEIRQVVLDGIASEVLVRQAADARMLVVGSRGHGRLTSSLLGSVGMACVHNASCPVVVLPARLATDNAVPQPSYDYAGVTPGPLL